MVKQVTQALELVPAIQQEAGLNADAAMDCNLEVADCKVEEAEGQNSNTPTTATTPEKALYVSVKTFEAGEAGKRIGFRVVDMYHYGTRNWLQKHIWWAMHHSYVVEQDLATEEQVANYLKDQALRLQDKYAAA